MTAETFTVRRGTPVPREPRYPHGADPERWSASVIIDRRRYAVTASVRWSVSKQDTEGRAYVDGAPAPVIPVPPHTTKGEYPDADAAWRVYNGAEERIMRLALEAVVAGEWRFSRKAGCTCGCSPGFIAVRNPRWGNRIIDVKVKPF